MSPHDVECPTCDAGPGQLCRTDDGHAVIVAHPDRVVAARTETLAGLGRMSKPSRFAWRNQ